jgi:hypothetical protein
VAVDGRFWLLGALGVGDDCRREAVRCISVGEVVQGASPGNEMLIDGCFGAIDDLEDEGWMSIMTDGLELDDDVADGVGRESGLAPTTMAGLELPESDVLLVDSTAQLRSGSTPVICRAERYESR